MTTDTDSTPQPAPKPKRIRESWNGVGTPAATPVPAPDSGDAPLASEAPDAEKPAVAVHRVKRTKDTPPAEPPPAPTE